MPAAVPPSRRQRARTSARSNLRELHEVLTWPLPRALRPKPLPDPTKKPQGTVLAVQVAVFVTMPSEGRRDGRKSDGDVPEGLTIGIADAPWEKGDAWLGGD